MRRMRHLLTGGIVSIGIALGAAWLSASPSVRLLPDGTAVIRLSISHGGARNCRDRTEEELASLPANMRRRQVCDRRRLPVLVEMDIDGSPVVARLLPPGGIAGDVASQLYRTFPVPAGTHEISLRLRDSARTDGFDYTLRETVELKPAQNLAVDFRAEDGGFRLR